ncbi:hypothetical protein M569_05812, partial [Genlisea aurea]
DNPFSPRAHLIRYWGNRIKSDRPMSEFLLSKASPLTAAETAMFSGMVSRDTLFSRLPEFCAAADLFCPAEGEAVGTERHDEDSNFSFYGNKNFANYGNGRLNGVDQFKNYSNGVNYAGGGFSRYGREATGNREGFASYGDDSNVAGANFTSYGGGATGGGGDFRNYMPRVNVPNLRFGSYDSEADEHRLTFAGYSDDTNSGSQGFAGYGRNGNSAAEEFSSYGRTSNVVVSTFSGYGGGGNSANDSFKSYATNSNNPTNGFKSYGAGGNDGADDFANYRDSANAGADTFQSYGKDSNAQKSNFANYGKTLSGGVDSFKEYAKGAAAQSIGFKIYGENATFKEYSNTGITFDQYTKPTPGHNAAAAAAAAAVPEGKFFRETTLREGNTIRMANIRDWMPERSFLPRTITSKLPFSKGKLVQLKRLFRAKDNSTLDHILAAALAECGRAPSPGETKRCVASVEDMIDFAVSTLGPSIAVRTTANTNGSGRTVQLKNVEPIDGGKSTKSVSCHQTLYPYLLYYCHSVPDVRVYEADIHETAGRREKINRGVAICHLDTASWSPNHGAFIALGSRPGLIEVCHWIFENDMTWTVAD